MSDNLNRNQGKNIKQIIAWSLYDFATSSYSAVIYTFVFSAYFINEIAPGKIQGTQSCLLLYGFLCLACLSFYL